MEELIEKLDLKPTDIQIGATFVNSITIYKLFDDFLIAECSTIGEPTPGKCLVWDKSKPQIWKYFSVDFLKDMPVSEIHKICYQRRVINN
jgi:hypothetical protein